jgi:hypothetical protein
MRVYFEEKPIALPLRSPEVERGVVVMLWERPFMKIWNEDGGELSADNLFVDLTSGQLIHLGDKVPIVELFDVKSILLGEK